MGRGAEEGFPEEANEGSRESPGQGRGEECGKRVTGFLSEGNSMCKGPGAG